ASWSCLPRVPLPARDMLRARQSLPRPGRVGDRVRARNERVLLRVAVNDRAGARNAVGDYVWRASPDAVARIVEAVCELSSLTRDDIARISALIHDPGMRHETATLLERWRS